MNTTTKAQRINARYEKIWADAKRLNTKTRFTPQGRIEQEAYAARVAAFEAQGMTTSDAQGVCDAEDMKRQAWRPLKQQAA